MNKLLSILAFIVCIGTTHAQGTLPFWNEIQAFKTADSISFPRKNQVLFIGSSSFRMWKKVNEDLPGYTILNRSFGGSTLKDQVRYRYDVMFPYQPKQIVLYCGENDLAESDTVTADMVVTRFTTLFGLMRSKYPDVPFVFVSIKPSPSREHLLPKVIDANAKIKAWLADKKKTVFVDVFHAMLNADGTIMQDIFLADRLHMNAKGYAIWIRLLKPHLLK